MSKIELLTVGCTNWALSRNWAPNDSGGQDRAASAAGQWFLERPQKVKKSTGNSWRTCRQSSGVEKPTRSEIVSVADGSNVPAHTNASGWFRVRTTDVVQHRFGWRPSAGSGDPGRVCPRKRMTFAGADTSLCFRSHAAWVGFKDQERFTDCPDTTFSLVPEDPARNIPLISPFWVGSLFFPFQRVILKRAPVSLPFSSSPFRPRVRKH